MTRLLEWFWLAVLPLSGFYGGGQTSPHGHSGADDGGVLVAANLPGSLTEGAMLSQNPHVVSATVTQAHGFGAQPFTVITWLRCLTAELGFSVGDRYPLASDRSEGGVLNGLQVTPDAVNIVLKTSATRPYILGKDNLFNFITSANWAVESVPVKKN